MGKDAYLRLELAIALALSLVIVASSMRARTYGVAVVIVIIASKETIVRGAFRMVYKRVEGRELSAPNEHEGALLTCCDFLGITV